MVVLAAAASAVGAAITTVITILMSRPCDRVLMAIVIRHMILPTCVWQCYYEWLGRVGGTIFTETASRAFFFVLTSCWC